MELLLHVVSSFRSFPCHACLKSARVHAVTLTIKNCIPIKFLSFDIVIYIPKAPFILFTNFHILSKNSRLFMNCRHFLAAGLCKSSLDEFVDICTFSMFQLLKICFVLCLHNVFGQFFFLEQ